MPSFHAPLSCRWIRNLVAVAAVFLAGSWEAGAGSFEYTVNEILNEAQPRLRACHRSVIRNGKSVVPSGLLKIQFEVSEYGGVNWARITESTLRSPEIENCVIQIIQALILPRPPDGDPKVVHYPLNFWHVQIKPPSVAETRSPVVARGVHSKKKTNKAKVAAKGKRKVRGKKYARSSRELRRGKKKPVLSTRKNSSQKRKASTTHGRRKSDKKLSKAGIRPKRKSVPAAGNRRSASDNGRQSE